MIQQPKPLEKFITVRVSVKTHKAFFRKAMQFGRTSDVLRELVEAFVDDRLKIQPSETKRNLYHVD